MTNLADIEGIGPTYAEKLKAAGVGSVEVLLKDGATPKDRAALAATTGISEKLVLRWTNMADLFRIKGVSEQYSDLLEASGVDTVPELAGRKPDNLLAKMTQVNEEKKLVRNVPTLEQVTAWVAEAGSLPRVLTY
jgi:predicted flap endonuclease-1-like 5' DNA nuclease